MPICKGFSSTSTSKKSATDIFVDHVTDAVQVKRSRNENDEIIVLPYSNYDDDAASEPSYCSRTRFSLVKKINRASSSNNGTGLNEFGYMQRLGSLFTQKSESDKVATAAAAAMTSISIAGGITDGPLQNHNAFLNDNFLLPRDALSSASYQNVGNDATNSMSFAASLLACQTADSSVGTPNEIKPVIEVTQSKNRFTASTANNTHNNTSGIEDTSMATSPAVAETATALAQTAATLARGGCVSHYSTDKSGSSGYYSSHMCSTYSLDEHIYFEPVIDIVDSIAKDKSKTVTKLQLPTNVAGNMTAEITSGTSHHFNKLKVPAVQSSSKLKTNTQIANNCQKKTQQQVLQPCYSEKLRNLETSIENLDLHLKTFQRLPASLQTVAFAQQDIAEPTTNIVHFDIAEKLRAYNQLPTIMEGLAATQKQQLEFDVDDSLQDIDLDAFLLEPRHKQQQSQQGRQNVHFVTGIDNPCFLSDDQLEENNYKCAKYINSCPEDAYRVNNEALLAAANEENAAINYSTYAKRYENQLHFQSTRELLEDVREKIKILSPTATKDFPQELNSMIQTLKVELESYLQRMIQHSELELRQLCSGLGRQKHVMRLQNAIERRRSFAGDFPTNESNRSVCKEGVLNSCSGPLTICTNIMSIRCASDPNFKMKRKSITDVFSTDECYTGAAIMPRSETLKTPSKTPFELKPTTGTVTQMQRNLTFHKPVLVAEGSRLRLGNGPEKMENIAEWHHKKPSIWEMYYGTNRVQQSLLCKERYSGELVAHQTLSYPSSRPESDFTLDLPRAEQLRLKMEKEKRFRQRCRFITTFLSLVFFFLTVIVVSLVLTRGKRMFGSMI